MSAFKPMAVALPPRKRVFCNPSMSAPQRHTLLRLYASMIWARHKAPLAFLGGSAWGSLLVVAMINVAERLA